MGESSRREGRRDNYGILDIRQGDLIMNWNELTSLKINGVEFVKLTRQSDGLVLFQKNLTPIPAQVNMTTYDFSTMIPSIIYVS